jgi:hypothetical protein
MAPPFMKLDQLNHAMLNLIPVMAEPAIVINLRITRSWVATVFDQLVYQLV